MCWQPQTLGHSLFWERLRELAIICPSTNAGCIQNFKPFSFNCFPNGATFSGKFTLDTTPGIAPQKVLKIIEIEVNGQYNISSLPNPTQLPDGAAIFQPLHWELTAGGGTRNDQLGCTGINGLCNQQASAQFDDFDPKDFVGLVIKDGFPIAGTFTRDNPNKTKPFIANVYIAGQYFNSAGHEYMAVRGDIYSFQFKTLTCPDVVGPENITKAVNLAEVGILLTPAYGLTIDQAASVCGVDHFNWLNRIEEFTQIGPQGSRIPYTASNCKQFDTAPYKFDDCPALRDRQGRFVEAPTIDPIFGGYRYMPPLAGDYFKWYCDEPPSSAGFQFYCVTPQSWGDPKYSFRFFDRPKALKGLQMVFTTQLVGMPKDDPANGLEIAGLRFDWHYDGGDCTKENFDECVNIGSSIFSTPSPDSNVNIGISSFLEVAPERKNWIYTSINYPAATYTDAWGINNTGQIAGTAIVGASELSFVYSSGLFAPLSVPPLSVEVSPVGLNDFGVVVGGAQVSAGASELGFILNGITYTFFSKPGWQQTEARAVGNSGIVTGTAFNNDAAGNTIAGVGFIYNRWSGNFTDISVPGAGLTLAQGFNQAGQVVGSGQLRPGFRSTGFLRQP